MSAKISALPAATTVSQTTDVLPIVQGAANKNVTREVFLSAKTGEIVGIFNGTGVGGVQVDASGQVDIGYASGTHLAIGRDSAVNLQFQGNGNVVFQQESGAEWRVQGNGGAIIYSGSGKCSILDNGGTSVEISFTPLASASWNTDPVNMAGAIDRLAAAVATLRGSPIP